MNKKKIGILCFSVMPYTTDWGASQRIHYMANTIANSDEYEVIVFGSKSFPTPVNFDKTQNYKTLFFDNPLGRRILGNKSETSKIINTQKNGIIDSIKKFIFKTSVKLCQVINDICFNEPVYIQGLIASKWIRDNRDAIVSQIIENKVQTLIISIPPWNMISLSFLNRIKKTGIKIIIDYRDPWNCWNDHKGIPLSKEKKILKYADSIIVTNENHANRLIKQFELPPSKVKVVMNGYDADLWNKISGRDGRTNDDKLNISYIGTIGLGNKSSFRDPRIFLSALSKFEHKDEIMFRIIGCRDEEALSRYQKIIPGLDMIPRVSQKESYEWMINSDVLANFHTTSDNSSSFLIAGKIFDYYRSGAALLSINGIESYERKFIEENEIGYYSPNDENLILKTLQRIYVDWKRDKTKFRRGKPSEDTYSRQQQNKKIFKILNEI